MSLLAQMCTDVKGNWLAFQEHLNSGSDVKDKPEGIESMLMHWGSLSEVGENLKVILQMITCRLLYHANTTHAAAGAKMDCKPHLNLVKLWEEETSDLQ